MFYVDELSSFLYNSAQFLPSFLPFTICTFLSILPLFCYFLPLILLLFFLS